MDFCIKLYTKGHANKTEYIWVLWYVYRKLYAIQTKRVPGMCCVQTNRTFICTGFRMLYLTPYQRNMPENHENKLLPGMF